MARTPKRIDVDVYGARGTGETKADAKAHAATRIALAFTDDWGYNPEMLRFPRGEVVVIYRTLDGWTYGLMGAKETRKTVYGMGIAASKEDATRQARRHIAQDYWDDRDTDGGHTLLDATDLEGHREQERHAAFEKAYRRYAGDGRSDSECHRLACNAMTAA